MSFTLTGILKKKFDTKEISDRYSKREFVLTTESGSKYPQHVPMIVSNKNCKLLDNLREGDEISVEFRVLGREFDVGTRVGIKYFATLEAYKIELKNKTNEKISN